MVKQEGLECAQEDVVRLLQGIDIDRSNSLNNPEFLAATMEASYAEGLVGRGGDVYCWRLSVIFVHDLKVATAFMVMFYVKVK